MNELICTPVMLPMPPQAIGNCLVKDNTGMIFMSAGESERSYATRVPQHLYLVSSNDIPNLNEWYINMHNATNARRVQIHREEKHLINHKKDYRFKECRKVITSTDKSLSLPLIPSSFIERWVNEQGKIGSVKVRSFNGLPIHAPNDDNKFSEVIILPIEDKTYSREELRKNMLEAVNYGSFLKLKMDAAKEGQTGEDIFNDWFDDNY